MQKKYLLNQGLHIVVNVFVNYNRVDTPSVWRFAFTGLPGFGKPILGV